MQDKRPNQQSRVLLNYYPCSYGDTLGNMFAGIAPKWLGNNSQSSWGGFKFPEFYSLSLEDKIICWNDFRFSPVTSCHRQHSFDFNSIEPVQVISIRVNDREWLYKRVMKLHWDTFNLGDSTLDRIRQQLAPAERYKIVEAEYLRWDQQNILPSDLVLDFELIVTDQIESWCQEHNLHYDADSINIIKEDLKNYQ